MLPIDIRSRIEDHISGLNIDTSELDSYRWESDPYGVDPELRGSSGCYVWDEDEEFEAQKLAFIEDLETEELSDHLDGVDDSLKQEVIDWLKKGIDI